MSTPRKPFPSKLFEGGEWRPHMDRSYILVVNGFQVEVAWGYWEQRQGLFFTGDFDEPDDAAYTLDEIVTLKESRYLTGATCETPQSIRE